MVLKNGKFSLFGIQMFRFAWTWAALEWSDSLIVLGGTLRCAPLWGAVLYVHVKALSSSFFHLFLVPSIGIATIAVCGGRRPCAVDCHSPVVGRGVSPYRQVLVMGPERFARRVKDVRGRHKERGACASGGGALRGMVGSLGYGVVARRAAGLHFWASVSARRTAACPCCAAFQRPNSGVVRW